MSEQDWSCKRLSLHPEDVRYDSGLADSVQSLPEEAGLTFPSVPDDGPATSSSSSPPLHGAAEDKVSEMQELERLDSTYGSVSLTESLPQTSLPPSGATESGSQDSDEQLDSLMYLSEEGDTLLHLSIIHAMPKMALYFISLAPKDVLNIQNDLSQSALHLAVYLGQVGVVEALVDKDVSLELQDRRGDTALHLACAGENLACAVVLLRGSRRRQNLLQIQNWKGLSCLHIATMKRNPALISLLIESGADINSQEGNSGKTPLHLAVQMVDRPLLLHLLQHSPKVDALMYNGCTPLHLAVGSEDAGLARVLCQAGADILQRNLEGDTPQDLAEGNNQLFALLPFDDLKISGKPVVTSA
ncbi:NF-kappa-B inhibitor epsilon [Anomaloglossus baeobatrachus]|uniref:NF-kappa-B inhibitor epsilon n=1 Tax=Anomaloglossus baeobatrachus TaxID=238106 RepID=UPI003F50299B